jgi:hypothetical protein
VQENGEGVGSRSALIGTPPYDQFGNPVSELRLALGGGRLVPIHKTGRIRSLTDFAWAQPVNQ